jgi:hypothetical protein
VAWLRGPETGLPLEPEEAGTMFFRRICPVKGGTTGVHPRPGRGRQARGPREDGVDGEVLTEQRAPGAVTVPWSALARGLDVADRDRDVILQSAASKASRIDEGR